MRLVAAPVVLALVLPACTSLEGRSESKGDPSPQPPVVADRPATPPVPKTPEVPPAPRVALRGAIASVSLIQNCPDDEPSVAPSPMPARPGEAASQPSAALDAHGISAGASAKPGGPGIVQPCTQSFVQLTLSHDGAGAQRVSIAAVRLLASGVAKELASVPFRGPTRWDDAGRYVPWDQTIPAATEIKASYKLADPDWSAVAGAVGNADTYAPRYVLEVDVVLDGRTTTLRSNDFQREHAHVIVT